MALTLSTMQTETYARGLADLNDGGAGVTRVTRWLNDAMHLIDELADWPYLLGTTTGVAPLTIADLRTVQCVTDIANLNTLAPRERADLRDDYADLTTAGVPTNYYFTAPTTIAVYPTSTSVTLTVDYFKFSPDLASAGDAPLMPDRFRMCIVHYAVAQALKDRGDTEGAALAKQDGGDIVQLMINSLLLPQHQRASQWMPAVGDDQ
jgi:hypothetical protein